VEFSNSGGAAMGIGGSLVVIAIGAILRFAVYRQDIGGVNVGMIGTILLIVGIVGLVISIVLLTMRRRTDVVVRDDRDAYSRTYVEPSLERRTYVEPPPDRGPRL
jgi:tetrahydromethanopterin S-methyltransferase subunit E